jgi:hypothetical protein
VDQWTKYKQLLRACKVMRQLVALVDISPLEAVLAINA